MTQIFPPPPAFGTTMRPANPSADARRVIALRRSVSKRTLAAPGPTPSQLDELLSIATRVPDHRRLAPWRFIVFEGDARSTFNALAVDIQRDEQPNASDVMLADTASYLTRAPVVVAIISSPDTSHKTPIWEQELSAGALCQNLLLAANASGWAGCWLTEWISFSPGIKTLMGLTDDERIAGFIYLGTATNAPQERMRPDAAGLITRWNKTTSD